MILLCSAVVRLLVFCVSSSRCGGLACGLRFLAFASHTILFLGSIGPANYQEKNPFFSILLNL